MNIQYKMFIRRVSLHIKSCCVHISNIFASEYFFVNHTIIVLMIWGLNFVSAYFSGQIHSEQVSFFVEVVLHFVISSLKEYLLSGNKLFFTNVESKAGANSVKGQQ